MVARQKMPHLDPMFISLDDLLKLMRHHQGWIDKRLADGEDDLMPYLEIVTKAALVDAAGSMVAGEAETTLVTIACSFNEDDEKHRLLRDMGADCRLRRVVPVAAILSSEMWMSPDVRGVEPRHHPEKREGVGVMGATMHLQHQAMVSMEITRGEGNKILPGTWSEIHTEGLRAVLLTYLWKGFFGLE